MKIVKKPIKRTKKGVQVASHKDSCCGERFGEIAV